MRYVINRLKTLWIWYPDMFIFWVISTVLFCVVFFVEFRVLKQKTFQGKMENDKIYSVVALSVYMIALICITVYWRIPKANYMCEVVPFWSYIQLLNGDYTFF